MKLSQYTELLHAVRAEIEAAKAGGFHPVGLQAVGGLLRSPVPDRIDAAIQYQLEFQNAFASETLDLNLASLIAQLVVETAHQVSRP